MSCSANKIFDYLESGLSIIYFKNNHIYGLAKHYGSVISVKGIKELRKEIIRVNKDRRSKNIKYFTLDFHYKRLGKVYSSLLKTTK